MLPGKEKREIRKFSELRNPISKGRVEWRYLCPFCPELIGKYDKDGALYFNIRKRVGACWKCRVAIVDDYNLDLESLYELHYARRRQPKRAQSYNIASWSAPAETVDWARRYLHRRGFDDDVIRRYHLRAADVPEPGIVIPDRIHEDGTTNFFQYRYVHATKIKYTNPTEADKPVYGQHTLAGHDRAFVCEGCFSSISMGMVSGWGSLATYGKAVPPAQLRILAQLPVSHYCLVYDGGEVEAILSAAETLLETGKSVSALLLPFREDPNSMDARLLPVSLAEYTLPVNQMSLALVRQYRKRAGVRNMHAASWDRLRDYVHRKFCRSSAEDNHSSGG